jgi:diketogulonate reductase-like aldo/keto reductase
MYNNEKQVGEAIASYPHINSTPRSELFIISKIKQPGVDVEDTYEGIKKSVEDIGLGGYVDLFLIHNPNYGVEGRKIQWKALEKAKKEGLVRAIGVSNLYVSPVLFDPEREADVVGIGSVLHHLEGMKEYAEELPSVNQTELHPWNQVSHLPILLLTGGEG